MNKDKINHIISRIPLHLVIILLVLIWIVPTLGLLVTSFRPLQDINTTGWWTVFTGGASAGAGGEYAKYCASCHGDDGKGVANVDLTNPDLQAQYSRSTRLTAMLRNGTHPTVDPFPTPQEAANIVQQMKDLAGTAAPARFTLNNYIDALMGYRGTRTYQQDCAAGTPPPDITCTMRDLLNPRGMGRAFLNSLIVTVPATILPILIAAFAAYAFSWMDFKGRQIMFATLVALQVVPLQMTLVPISRIYAQLGLNGQFLGIWLFHTGFGLPYAIYLIRNFLGTLPRDLFESAYLDGANHWMAFRTIAIPLAMPAIAALAIFQFLWVWNDLLVALVFLGGNRPVLTYQISNMVTSLGAGWQLLTAAAFISMLLPLIIFLIFQRYFVRGMLVGAVKG